MTNKTDIPTITLDDLNQGKYEKRRQSPEWSISIFFFGVVCGILILGAIVNIWPCYILPFQQEAVKSGHAEYFLDKDNNKCWRWKKESDHQTNVQNK